MTEVTNYDRAQSALAAVKAYIAETHTDAEDAIGRVRAIRAAWPNKPATLSNEDLSIARELFGAAFLTKEYPLADAQFIEEL